MPSPRSVWPAVYLALALVAMLPGTAYAVQAAPRHDPLASLRRQAEQAVGSLQKVTRAYEKQRSDLRKAKKDLRKTSNDLKVASRRLTKLRVPLARLVNARYQDPSSDFANITVSNHPRDNLRSATDAFEVTRQRSSVVAQAAALYDSKKRLASSAKRLVTSIQNGQRRQHKAIWKLRKKANRTVRTLTHKAARLGVAADRSGRLTMYSCDAKTADEAKQYPNGLIPKRYLCDLPQGGGFQLRADAAVAFAKLNAAYQARFHHAACVTSAYRDIAKQRTLYLSKPPGYAAVPGSSNHGLGLAVDFCGGVQNQGSPQFNWLRANSKKFGWMHPSWAYTGPFEPWHWEYVPRGGKPSSGGDQGDRAGH